MSVVIDNSHGSFLSEVDSLRDLIGVESEAELQEWRYLFVIHKFGLEEIVTKLNILNEEYDFLHASNPIEHIQTRIKNPKNTLHEYLLNRINVLWHSVQIPGSLGELIFLLFSLDF